MRILWSVLCAATLGAAALLTPGTATAEPIMVTAGFMIQSGSKWCTVSFVDPFSPRLAYTAAHCYNSGDSPEVRLGQIRVGTFVPQISSREPDLIAIRLSNQVISGQRLITGERLISSAPPAVGTKVCKYGATTQQTCGTIIQSTPTYMLVSIAAEHGDSGAPIYIRTGPDSRSGIHIVGTVYGNAIGQPGVLVATPISRIDEFLSNAYGVVWNL